MKEFNVTSICNALMDILIHARDEDLKDLGLTKGIMHLVDSQRQKEVLAHFKDADATVELGGSAMNCIRAMAHLGLKGVFAGGVCQHDEFGYKIEHRMQELGIKSRLKHFDEATGSCLILVTPDGQRTMNTCLGASRLYDESIVPHDDIAHSEIFHFSGYQWDTEEQKTAIYQALKTAKNNNVLVSFDVADPFVVRRHQAEFQKIIVDYADIVFANEEETHLLYDESYENAAKKISDAHAIAVIKLGALGAFIRRGEETYKIGTVPTTVVDTTAAGDMFAAGFLFGLIKKRDLGVCGNMGARLAGDVISRMGAHLSSQVLEDLKTL